MTSDQRVTAAFIIIGNEILSGRTQDANLSFLAGRLGALVLIYEVEVDVVDHGLLLAHLTGAWSLD